jgi:predicted lipase
MSAKEIYDNLQQDIQTYIVEEFIKPQLLVDELIQEFDKQLLSEECQSLQWQVLQDVVSKIIENKAALTQMFEKNNTFKVSYEQHFVKKVNTFKHSSFDGKPLASMCAELTMCRWH